ncbi:MAG: two-component regulator propeller domain-containing protein, partial [Akkermansia sp.]
MLALLSCFVFANLADAKSQISRQQDALSACPGEYVTDSLLASDGSIWVTTEGKGVYRYFPSKENKSKEDWMEGSYYQGLPDTVNFYALSEDRQGRIWVGTDNKGVAVFNGESWKVYDRENALIGERIFDINVSPVTGDVAIATSGGISIYNPKQKSWLSLTRADGLVADQVKALSYDLAGDLWIAYSCGGISQLSGRENYKLIQTVQTKWYWDEKSAARQPLTPTGEGLPSNLCDAILPLPNGGVVVGTSSGLGWMPNRKIGKWKFLRGKDYHDKNMGLINPPTLTKATRNQMDILLPEDYITCLTQSKQGIWVGFREKGAVLLDPSSMKKKAEAKFPENVTNPWVTSILLLPNKSVYATTYGFGLVKIEDGDAPLSTKLKEVLRDKNPEHPGNARIMSEEEISQELAKRDQQAKPTDSPVVFWKEDWATQGDWCERYGTHKGVLCATDQPRDDEVVSSDVVRNEVAIDIDGGIGACGREEWVKYMGFIQGDIVDNTNVIYNPKTGTRVA